MKLIINFIKAVKAAYMDQKKDIEAKKRRESALVSKTLYEKGVIDRLKYHLQEQTYCTPVCNDQSVGYAVLKLDGYGKVLDKKTIKNFDMDLLGYIDYLRETGFYFAIIESDKLGKFSDGLLESNMFLSVNLQSIFTACHTTLRKQ